MIIRSLYLMLTFIVGLTDSFHFARLSPQNHQRRLVPSASQQQPVSLDFSDMSDRKIEQLFAWVTQAFAGDDRYNNLVLALAVVFGDLPKDSPPRGLLEDALILLSPEEEPVGAPLSTSERESNSMGAMGAAQWSGRWMTRPHALLDVRTFSSVDDWTKSLPRGARRTLAKIDAQNFTVRALPIRGGHPAPHSSLAHFRCVLAHEVRLLGGSPQGYLDAVGEAVGRYMGTTRMAGEIREYRDPAGKVIAFAHEVRKGRVIRGQWFYATGEAAKSYVWFHSVRDLVERAISEEAVDVVDLGPSGSDAFSELKSKYGFKSVEDWPAVANYEGPFWHPSRDEDEGAI